jgi:reverse gyrase
VASLPTGSGKTFIAGLTAYFYNKAGLKVAIVTSDQFLVTQMLDMIGSIRHTIPFFPIEEAMTKSDEFDVFIIDEADQCIF